MGLLDWLRGSPQQQESRSAWPWDPWSTGVFTFNGVQYPFVTGSQTLGQKQELPDPSFDGYVQWAYKSNGIVFACILARMMLFSEARFQYRQLRSGRPGDLFGDRSLRPLERPWENATTGDLLARAMQDADLAGNFYCYREGQLIRRMRPDWVTIVMGSDLAPDEAGLAADAEVIGYIYKPPSSSVKPLTLLPEQVCHFAPIPDPTARFRGMSWLDPIVREIMGDNAATQHKISYFESGATPNMVVNVNPDLSGDAFQEFVRMFKAEHADLASAYRTIYMGGGSTVDTVGDNLQEIDFKVTQGAGETRIAAAAGVPPVIAGFSEGLDAATYSNYSQARRRFADLTMRPLWRNIAGSLATIIDVPPGSELWYDDRDIPFLQEDVKDAALVLETQSRAIRNLTDGGYDADSVVEAVTSGDLRRLKHTGLMSVQMQPPGADISSNGASTEEPAAV